MAVDNRSASALFKRAEQLRRWQESETNKTEIIDNNRPRKVNFSDGCIFLAACAAGDKQEVLRLLEKGADIDTANVDGLTALHAACIDDNLDMVEFLVDQGADVNRGDMEGWTALHATASCGFNSIAKFLIDRGADLSLVNNDGDLAIDIADSDEMESLLQREIETRGIDCDASRNEEERRMLEDAQMWLGAGYLADRPHPKTGATALHVASAKGYIKVMSLLLEAGSDINAQDLDGWTPLHAAAHWGQREAVEILAENMADMDVRNFVGQSAFDVADNSLLRLMDELKRKQVSMKVTQNKQTPRKRKTSPHREHSNKKEREDQRESDGTSGDESSSDVEKKNKVNKENATPQIIPTSVLSEKNSSRALPQARADSTMDESEVQSWRRPSSLRKTISDDKNQKEEVSRNISTQPRLSTRESEDILTGKRAPEKDERNHVDSMARVTLPQEPNVSTSSVVTTNASPPARTIGRSFVPPSRDEESETQRKAHAKMVRSTRRSTQGVTLEDIKSAEQLMKNKQQQQLQQQAPTSSPESKESPSSTLTVSTPTTQGTPTTTPSSPSSKPKPESPTKPEEEERRPSWRLKVDETDKNKFSLENVRSKDKPEVENDAESVTVPLRKKNSEEKADEDKDSERVSQTREGTQAAIQRRKKPKRRSTGRVQVNMDEIDPEKRAQRLAEQQQQPGDEGSEEEEEEKDSVSVGLCRPDEVTCRCTFPLVSDDLADGVPGTEVTLRSVSERGEASKGSTTSLGSTINSRPSSRAPSLGPENGDIDYKKLYEEQLEENFRVHERLRDTESELRQTREAIDLNNKKNNTRLAMAEADKREKRALERKLSEMEEELKQLQKLKAENEKLKAENRALTRVVSKLTNSATSGMGNLATLSK
ncbi:protein phosphatase 1 regulatory subunit 12B-like isoform X7 [Penaeus chinensis]|uniref:protein phosphatase 1 regulatory subunit 12B-like isoform X7 n=1 Tax=Penaeus chinensis TaxID=139456 RepID=UPI001FB5EB3B|nr:protein phosphatase 1 regulatory subunit 12B-like isoform X7 [Penaeus chinensis]